MVYITINFTLGITVVLLIEEVIQVILHCSSSVQGRSQDFQEGGAHAENNGSHAYYL